LITALTLASCHLRHDGHEFNACGASGAVRMIHFTQKLA